MAVARHEAGPLADLRALASQVHPVFMLPPLATSVLGAALAGDVALATAALHATAMFAAVYTAHVKDGYVDYYARGEDDDHPMTAAGCRRALAGATGLFASALAGVWTTAGPLATALTAPTWAIGFLHAPQLDTNPVTATLGYPVGVGLCLVGGYATQAGALAARPLALATVLVVLLAGVKIVDDATDHAYDRSIDKRTVAVVLGRGRARTLAFALMGLSAFLVVALAVDGLFPPGAALAPVAFGAVAVVAWRAEAETATALLVRGCYLLLAVLVVAVWFRPLAGIPLPDIGVLGPWTYLATEVAFGAAALWLLVRAGSLREAARTIAAIYPVAYLWDWYTLEVGVFAIPLRTGVELLGIPLEEHVFMVVVPAFVLGIHATVNPRDGDGDGDPAGQSSRD